MDVKSTNYSLYFNHIVINFNCLSTDKECATASHIRKQCQYQQADIYWNWFVCCHSVFVNNAEHKKTKREARQKPPQMNEIPLLLFQASSFRAINLLSDCLWLAFLFSGNIPSPPNIPIIPRKVRLQTLYKAVFIPWHRVQAILSPTMCQRGVVRTSPSQARLDKKQ